ncbi:hypothetical protein R3P38DRAFT_3188630 [Favolaschia claudopus]|uniref:Uncharacterized protein n=1 Tax=Favolaschia claudopus TaxID=2862362 RepID=A0AAW0BS26_9AGAR
MSPPFLYCITPYNLRANAAKPSAKPSIQLHSACSLKPGPVVTITSGFLQHIARYLKNLSASIRIAYSRHCAVVGIGFCRSTVFASVSHSALAILHSVLHQPRFVGILSPLPLLPCIPKPLCALPPSYTTPSHISNSSFAVWKRERPTYRQSPRRFASSLLAHARGADSVSSPSPYNLNSTSATAIHPTTFPYILLFTESQNLFKMVRTLFAIDILTSDLRTRVNARRTFNLPVATTPPWLAQEGRRTKIKETYLVLKGSENHGMCLRYLFLYLSARRRLPVIAATSSLPPLPSPPLVIPATQPAPLLHPINSRRHADIYRARMLPSSNMQIPPISRMLAYRIGCTYPKS